MSNRNRTRVVIADGHAAVRTRLRLLLESQSNTEVVGEAGDTSEALAEVCSLKPDIVLLDIALGGNDGLRVQEQIAGIVPKAKVLILGTFFDPTFVRTAMAAGAAGCLSTNAVHAELLKAVRVIRAGKRYIDSILSEALLPDSGHKRPALSQRELQVLLLIASGHSYKEIADQMLVSVKTVDTYRARIIKKSGLRRRAQFVQYAIDSGLLSRSTV